MDPRYAIYDVYQALRQAQMSAKEFEEELNKVSGPEEAILLCNKWQTLVRSN